MSHTISITSYLVCCSRRVLHLSCSKTSSLKPLPVSFSWLQQTFPTHLITNPLSSVCHPISWLMSPHSTPLYLARTGLNIFTFWMLQDNNNTLCHDSEGIRYFLPYFSPLGKMKVPVWVAGVVAASSDEMIVTWQTLQTFVWFMF